MNKSEKYGYNLPEKGEFYDVNLVNENTQKTEDLFQQIEDGTIPVGALGNETAEEWQGKIDGKFDKSGGNVNGYLQVHHESDACPLLVYNDASDGRRSVIGYRAGGTKLGKMGFQDANNPIWVTADDQTVYNLLHSGNVGSYAITLEEFLNNSKWRTLANGFDLNNAFGRYRAKDSSTIGTLLNLPSGMNTNGEITVEWFPSSSNNLYGMQILRQHQVGGGSNVYIRTRNNTTWLSWDTLLHTGNKPTGSYTGNGSATARSVYVGGIGEILYIIGNSWTTTVSTNGGQAYSYDGKTVSIPKSELKFEQGTLTMATSNVAVNSNSVTYTYRLG